MSDVDSAVFSFVSSGKIASSDFDAFLHPVLDVGEWSCEQFAGLNSPVNATNQASLVPAPVASAHEMPGSCSIPRLQKQMSGFSLAFCDLIQSEAVHGFPIPEYNSELSDGFEIASTFSSDDPSSSSEDTKSPTCFNAQKSQVRKSEAGGHEHKACWGRMKRRRNKKPVFWTRDEHERFLEGLEKFGMKKYLGKGGAELLAMFLGTRTATQVKSHAQKHFQLAKEGIDSRTLFVDDEDE